MSKIATKRLIKPRTTNGIHIPQKSDKNPLRNNITVPPPS